ncbi:MAG: hypothetical protein QM788_06465 [Roseateles sp.]|uniref:hypothetical protein n=1 Tax=Roseateles sp. TaxID=1971397 RepID=UPI0039EA8F9E
MIPRVAPTPAAQPGPTGLARRRLLCLGAALACPGAARAAAEARLPALIPDDVLLDYQRFLAGRDPATVSDYGGAHARRDVAEAVLIQQALLARPGPPMRLSLRPMPTSMRLQTELRTGHAACGATTYWREDFPEPEGLLFSDAVLADGEFEAGLYTTPGNARALAARSLADVRRLRVLSNRTWRVDWQTLERLGITQLQHVASWNLMPRMLQQGRADVLLAPFQPTPDLALAADGVRLLPIPGLKIRMRGTRHFLVSAAHPSGPLLREQLDLGLARLRQQGLVRRAYLQSGFFTPRVADWTAL